MPQKGDRKKGNRKQKGDGYQNEANLTKTGQ